LVIHHQWVRTDPRVQLGKSVRAQRLALGWSQEGLAEKADLHWTYIGGIERGERNVSLLNIVKLARALGITPSQLMASVR
jgi:transcriptional regulator with XRE-family HTH domain